MRRHSTGAPDSSSIKEVKKRNSCTLCVFAVLILLALVFPLRVRAGVIGDDDRVLVDYAHSGPFRSIVALDVTRGDGRSGIVSGFMVDEFHVVTAAHNVWFPDGLQSAEAIPGLNGTDEPFGRATVTNVRLFPSWAAGNGIDGGGDDIALLTLDRNVGFFTGWMTLHTAPSWHSIYYQVPTYVAGYPDKVRDEWVKGYMYFDGDSGDGADEDIHWYFMDTSMGMSGSPVWIEELLPPPTRYLVLSVHTDFDNGKNHGTRISQDKLDQLNDWMSQDTPPTDYADLTYVVEDAGFTPNSVVRGETDFSVWAGVRNVGTVPSGPFTAQFILSTSDDPRYIYPNRAWILASVDVPSINPFTERSVSWSGTFPVNMPKLDGTTDRIPSTGAGGYCVYFMIDVNNEVTEFNEDDTFHQIPRDDGSGIRVAVYNNPPIAEAGGPYRQQPGFPIIFDGSASYDLDGYITTFKWDFGYFYSPTPEQLETFWSMGDVNRDDYIDDTDGELIEAAWLSTPGDASWNPDADLNGDLIVNMDDTTIWSGNYGLDIWTYFGLRARGIGATPTHTYMQEGTYIVTLTVKDDEYTPGEDQDDAIVTIVRTRIESCDAVGVTQDSFYPSEDVYVVGSGYLPSILFPQYYPIYVVEDTTWTHGMPIPARIPDTATSVYSNAAGGVGPTLVWSNPLISGRFDIVVDFNKNGLYDKGIDALDDMDIEVSAGFFVAHVVDVEASDPSGFFTVTIDAGADKGVPVTSWTEISTTNIASYTVTLTDGDMIMVIEGQLLDPSLEGQIVLEVDPVGKIITYEINIAPYEAPTIVPEFGLSAAIMMSLAAIIYLTLRKRVAKKSAGAQNRGYIGGDCCI